MHEKVTEGSFIYSFTG